MLSDAKKLSMTLRVADPDFEQDEWQAGELARLDFSAFRELVRRCRNQKQFLAQRGHRHQVGLLDRQRQQPGVDAAAADLLHRPPRQGDRQPHVQVRVDPAEVLEQRRKHVKAHGHAARQPKRAAQLARPVGNRADRLAHVQEHALAQLHEAFRRRRHPHLTADAQKQRLAQLLLEQENLAADRRLRDVQLPPARGEGAGLGDGLENLQLAKVHGSVYCSRTPCQHARCWKSLYVQVLIGIAAGIILGFVAPETGAAMRPLGDGFIKLVKMLIAPIVFSTVVVGIAHMGAMREVGRIGLRALLYFEVVSTLALVIGMVVVNVLQPGSGITIDPASLDMKTVSTYTAASKGLTTIDFILNVIPTTVVDAFTKGEILQVLLFSVLFGLAALSLGKSVAPLVALLDQTGKTLFAIVGIIMRLAPIGAFGAMAFTVGRYGVGSLISLGQLMAGMYITCLLFVFVVLGAIARAVGFRILPFLKYISEEILIVLGTSSSESALPKIMEKLERIGCPKPVVGLVVPTGYSFNLDGTSIYMTMAALFVAQASGVHLSLQRSSCRCSASCC